MRMKTVSPLSRCLPGTVGTLLSIGLILLPVCGVQAKTAVNDHRHPTSKVSSSEKQCRLDIYHLVKKEGRSFRPNLQIAFITDNLYRQRYVAMKTGISHPTGFENISYYRSGQPIEVFTANWRNNGTKHTVSRLVILGGTSDKQAFDVLSGLMKTDQGHFELRDNANRYRLNANRNDITAFFTCLNDYYHE
ncbi:hypothetical protein ACFFLZ_06965 [Photobacterium aphoticum]|nr:hypothetical protein [Photobacterium aphoticum]PSU60339.1 hypothetical protein C9I90_01615 [Photobacterium aphoticum]